MMVEPDTSLLVLKMEETGSKPRNSKQPSEAGENNITLLPRASRNECSPANTLILALLDLSQTLNYRTIR